jgi:YHS domain-containing protein
MRKKLSIVIAACAAVAVIFAGANSFACGGRTCSKTAAAKSNACGMSGCCAMKGAADMSSAQGTSCQSGATSAWTSKLCGDRGYYAANVYEVQDGRIWAVCCGKKFEVTASTPYTQVGGARYYFADEASKTSCAVKMSQMTAQMDREAVSLASMDGNVVGEENGQKIAQCLVTGRKFLVTADSPVMVADGKKYYRGDTTDLSSLAGTAQRN